MTIAAAVLLALAGCGQKADEAPGHQVTISDGNGQAVAFASDAGGNVATISAGGPEGGQVRLAAGGDWPASIASFAPAYPGGTIGANLAGLATAGDKGGAMVTFTTSDQPAVVIAFYKARATAAGLTQGTAASANGAEIWDGRDDRTGRTLQVQAHPEDGHTSAVVMAGVGGK